MKELSSFERLCFYAGFIAMIIGGFCYALFLIPLISCWLMLGGALLFGYSQYRQKYLGNSFVIKRLRRYLLTANALLVLSGLFMAENTYHLLMKSFVNNIGNYMLYVNIFHNNWVILMLIGALLLVYTTIRISNELQKEKQ